MYTVPPKAGFNYFAYLFSSLLQIGDLCITQKQGRIGHRSGHQRQAA